MPLIDAPVSGDPPRFLGRAPSRDPIHRKWGRPGRPGANDRPALPSGHPVTWGAITDGTSLAGAHYPFPVFWGGWDVRPSDPDEEEVP